MAFLLCSLLGAVLVIAFQAAARHLRAPQLCSWCTRASGHEVSGHTFDHCRGPRLAEQQRAEINTAHQQALKHSQDQLTRHTEQRKTERARAASRLRIEHIGNVTTRGREIHLAGWRFTTFPFGTEADGGQAYTYKGDPEEVSGWDVDELHAMAHGGACRCDVERLAKTLR